MFYLQVHGNECSWFITGGYLDANNGIICFLDSFQSILQLPSIKGEFCGFFMKAVLPTEMSLSSDWNWLILTWSSAIYKIPLNTLTHLILIIIQRNSTVISILHEASLLKIQRLSQDYTAEVTSETRSSVSFSFSIIILPVHVYMKISPSWTALLFMKFRWRMRWKLCLKSLLNQSSALMSVPK